MGKVERGEHKGEQSQAETGAAQRLEQTPLFYPAELHARNTEVRRAMATLFVECGLSAKAAARVLHLPSEE